MQLGLPFGMRYQYVKFISLVGQNRVSDLIGNQRWVLPTARNSFLEDIWQEIRALDLSPVPLPDRVVWTLSTEGDFSFKSAWQLVRKKYPKVEYKNILWHTDLIPRHSAWMAVNNGLYTLDKVSIFRLLAYSLALIMSPLSIFLFGCEFVEWIVTALFARLGLNKHPSSLPIVIGWIKKSFASG